MTACRISGSVPLGFPPRCPQADNDPLLERVIPTEINARWLGAQPQVQGLSVAQCTEPLPDSRIQLPVPTVNVNW